MNGGAANRWIVTAAAAIGMSLSVPVYQSYLFGLFVKPLQADFGWGRGQLSVAITLCNYVIMLAAPFMGQVVDRRGARAVVLPAIFATALIVALGALNRGQLLAFYAVHAALAIVGLGTLPLSYTRVIVGWFDRNRGLALGAGLAGIGLGGAIFPLLVQRVIGQYGWRWGYVAISALMLCVAFPVVAMLLRENPKRHCDDAQISSTASDGLTLKQAAGTIPFWLLLLALLLLGAVTTGVSVHLAPLLSDRGLDGTHVAAGVGVLGLSLVVGRVVAGLLLDRLPAPLIAGLTIIGSALGLVLLADATTPAALAAGVILVGLGIGAEFDFLSFFIARLLGLKHYGAIYGAIYAGFMFGCAAGPGLMGFVFDRQGAYTVALRVLACFAAVAAVAFMALGATRARTRQAVTA